MVRSKLALWDGPDHTITSQYILAPFSTCKIFLDGVRVIHATHIISLGPDWLFHILYLVLYFPIFLPVFPFLNYLVRRGQHTIFVFLVTFIFLPFELDPFLVKNEKKDDINRNLADTLCCIFTKTGTKVLRCINFFAYYVPKSQLGAKSYT